MAGDSVWNKRLWRDLIEPYTQLDLTYCEDRLPALSGIASQALLKNDYLAGLNRESLLQDLCWRPYQLSNSVRPVSRVPGAPSWSWASVNGHVSWPSRMERMPPSHLEVLEAFCVPAGENVYGRISHGHLILRGVALETKLPPLVKSSDNFEFQCSYAHQIEPLADGGLSNGRWYLDCTSFDDAYLSAQSVLLLIMSPGRPSLNGLALGDNGFALILRKVKSDETVYERIGAAGFENVAADYFDNIETRVVEII